MASGTYIIHEQQRPYLNRLLHNLVMFQSYLTQLCLTIYLAPVWPFVAPRIMDPWKNSFKSKSSTRRVDTNTQQVKNKELIHESHHLPYIINPAYACSIHTHIVNN
jgi:hypothetical protein